jgi:CheY-like chemotaxis protein
MGDMRWHKGCSPWGETGHASQATMTTRPLGSVPPPAGGRRSVLVVDDDRASRDGLRAALSHQGHQVETATDAWQAIGRLRQHRFDVAVVDLDLPPVHGMDLGGWDVARIARAYTPGIVLVLVSAEDDPASDRQAQGLGSARILAKPISLEQLTALVEAVPKSAPRTGR